jgi:hypothetical protein
MIRVKSNRHGLGELKNTRHILAFPNSEEDEPVFIMKLFKPDSDSRE